MFSGSSVYKVRWEGKVRLLLHHQQLQQELPNSVVHCQQTTTTLQWYHYLLHWTLQLLTSVFQGKEHQNKFITAQSASAAPPPVNHPTTNVDIPITTPETCFSAFAPLTVPISQNSSCHQRLQPAPWIPSSRFSSKPHCQPFPHLWNCPLQLQTAAVTHKTRHYHPQ